MKLRAASLCISACMQYACGCSCEQMKLLSACLEASQLCFVAPEGAEAGGSWAVGIWPNVYQACSMLRIHLQHREASSVHL